MALLMFGFCVVPLVALAALSTRAIQTQTLEVAERHLAEHAKSYAMSLITRLEVAAWELSIRETADGASAVGEGWRWVEPDEAVEPLPARSGAQPMLEAVPGGFRIAMPVGGRPRSGFLSDDELFAHLDQAPFGVRTCVRLAGEPRRCAGEASGESPVRASWRLPLASMYDTDVVIQVDATEPRELVLDRIGVLYRVLPYLVLALMSAMGWWVLRELRVRFEPVAQLRRATERIHRGDYSASVDIRSGDELESLGRAFNAMSRRLFASFTTMRALSEMDHMLLNGADLEDLLRQALVLLRDLGRERSVVWLWDEERYTGVLHRLDTDNRVEQQRAPLGGPAPRDLREAVQALERDWGVDTVDCALVIRSGAPAGVIACTRAGAEQERNVLAELGDRISVAVTLFSNSRELFEQTHYDALTGLLNREAFAERLDRATSAHARSARGALICFDLDRFKQVNDTGGHHAGDRLLVQIAERIRKTVRAADEVARLGGDEFGVLVLSMSGTEEVEVLCRRLIAEISRPVDVDGDAHVAEVSLGVVVFPDDGSDAPTLMRKADVAMYKSKEQSGSAFTFFDPEMNQETEQRARIERRLRRALTSRELCLYFQPKIRAVDGTVAGVEGLLRWPSDPNMHPGRFIPVAEHTGLIHEFTRVLVEDGKSCLEQCREAGFDLGRVAVNISPRQFQRGGFAEGFLGHLEIGGARPGDFEIEVTESVFVNDPLAVADDLRMLRAAGVTVALDDFGTGYSSLNVIRELPLDVIKIDRSFVAPVIESAQARDLLGRIIDIIHSLDLLAVAEGVETGRELEILMQHRCDVVQGFHFSPALPVHRLLEFLGKRARTPRLA